MKRLSRFLPVVLFVSLLVAMLSMGVAPLLASEDGPETEVPSLGDSLTAQEGPAATSWLDVTNEAKTVAGGLSVSDNRFTAKVTGKDGGEASLDVIGDLANTTINEGQKGDPLFATLIAYGLKGGVSAKVDGSVVMSPGEGAQSLKDFCGVFNKVSEGTSAIEVTGDINATGRGDADGIKMDADSGSKATLKVGQNLLATSGSEGEEEYDAFAADIQSMDGSDTSLEVGGSVKAVAGDSSRANSCGARVTSVANDGQPAASCMATVHGGIEALAKDMAIGAKLSAQGGSRAKLVVDGDSSGLADASGMGVWLESVNGGIAEVFVRGVIRGSSAGVRFDGADAGSFDITTWKIETSAGSPLFQKGDYATCSPEDVAARTNYIIRLEQPEAGGTIAAVDQQKRALAQSHDLPVAHAGEKVYLDVTLEPGYLVKGAYNGKDERVPLERDEGGYYVTVPEGGGVSLSVELAPETSAAGMKIDNGMAQPVFAYSDVFAKDYTNEKSELYRFVVYVETDYDTDRDGKCDLVKTFVQVPRAAVQGRYKAPVLFSADPYSAGRREAWDDFKFASSSVDDAALMDKPAHRTPAGGISAEELALNKTMTKASDWNYELDEKQFPMGLTALDYYLVRGFAVVQSAGLGTYGSEGIECCGTVMERDAFVDVVEWLHGTQGRTAYADAAGTIEVKADWSSGHVGMTGLSYPGAMCYEVATSGVEGLDTVVPVAGPASWYDQSNSQGIAKTHSASYNYTTVLSDVCASRLFSNPEQGILDLYQRYRTYTNGAQSELAGDYGPFWAARDWYTGTTGIRASALIVHGLNDGNVSTKHSDLMRSAFLASGCEVKMLLHQNTHVFPADEDNHADIMIGNHTYLEWLNLWFTRALLGEDNEAATLPSFTVQSNVDGSFYNSERWNADDVVTMYPGEGGETTVHAEGAPMSVVDAYRDSLPGKTTKNAAFWQVPVNEQFTIAGRIPVRVRAKVDDVSPGDIMMSAVLYDVSDEPFGAFAIDGDVSAETVSTGDGTSPSYGVVTWKQGQTKKKLIASGTVDLRNPEADYEPATATKRTQPIEADTYYDYTIWLNPTYYTAQKGHRLELYVVPFLSYATYGSAEDRDYMLQRQGLDSSSAMNIRTDYSFTIQNGASFAALPLVEEVSYALADTGEATWSKGSTGTLAFTWKRTIHDPETFRHFAGVVVDGAVTEPSNYGAKAGSAVVSLSAKYLDSLAEGDHTIYARFDDGTGAQATFKVVGKETSEQDKRTTTPKTADESPDALPQAAAATLAVMAFALAAAAKGRDESTL